jgi:hypothetical protein
VRLRCCIAILDWNGERLLHLVRERLVRCFENTKSAGDAKTWPIRKHLPPLKPAEKGPTNCVDHVSRTLQDPDWQAWKKISIGAGLKFLSTLKTHFNRCGIIAHEKRIWFNTRWTTSEILMRNIEGKILKKEFLKRNIIQHSQGIYLVYTKHNLFQM